MNLFRSSAVPVAVALLTACSSTPPQPAMPDGSARVPANDPSRVLALQERVAQDRALLSENNLLKAQVNALQRSLNEMTSIVREALVLPAPAPMPVPPQARQPVPQSLSKPAPGPAQTLGSVNLPKEAYSVGRSGVVIRVFHEFARTEFEPSAEVAQALREAVRQADSVQVRGRTDSAVQDDINRLIAIERAMKARSWLLANGVAAEKISVRYSSAGQFLADNSTEEGRSLNRRVEIDVSYGQPSNS